MEPLFVQHGLPPQSLQYLQMLLIVKCAGTFGAGGGAPGGVDGGGDGRGDGGGPSGG